MTEYRTVMATETRFAAVLAAVRAAAPEVEIAVDGASEAWKRIELRTAGASLRLTSMQYVEGGDKFSRMLLGLYGHFRPAAKQLGEAGTRTLSRISTATFAIGVVAEPTVSAEEWITRVLGTLTLAVDGMVFDGEVLWSGDGQELLRAGGANP